MPASPRQRTKRQISATTRADFVAVFAMLRAGKISTARLNSRRASLEQASTASPHRFEPSSGLVKALIEI
jgi:hypothetical protein